MVIRFVKRNSINPGFQAAVASERADIPEDLEKDFLNDIRSLGRIVHQPVNQVVNGLLEGVDEALVSFRRSGA